MSFCTVKFCRQSSVIQHKPMKADLCRKHWEAHCDGEKLEVNS